MAKELAPVGDGDPVAVRLVPKKGQDFPGLAAEGYHCSVSKSAPLEMLQLSLANEMKSVGVRCSNVVLHDASGVPLERDRRLEDGCFVLPSLAQRRQGRRLDIAFRLEGCHAKPLYPTASAETSWGLPKRYILERELGRGAYGEVREARDTVAGEAVAVKRIRCFFDNLVDAKRLLREVSIVRQIRSDSLVRLRDVCLGEGDSPTSFDKVFLVFDKCDGDLQHMISRGAALEERRAVALLHGILGGLACLHSQRILHRDLKPANCLLKDGRLLLADLGLSRQALPVCAAAACAGGALPPLGLSRQLTRHVVTRCYRPPELLLSGEPYGEPVDIWASGCIFGELLQLVPSGGPSGPLFPGKGSPSSPAASSLDPAEDMLAVIVRVLGPVSEADKALLEEASRCYVGRAERTAQGAPGEALERLAAGASAGALGLLQELLAFAQARRPGAHQALDRVLFAGLPRLPPSQEQQTAGPGFDVPDDELRDPSRRPQFLAELRGCFRRELDACCSGLSPGSVLLPCCEGVPSRESTDCEGLVRGPDAY